MVEHGGGGDGGFQVFGVGLVESGLSDQKSLFSGLVGEFDGLGVVGQFKDSGVLSVSGVDGFEGDLEFGEFVFVFVVAVVDSDGTVGGDVVTFPSVQLVDDGIHQVVINPGVFSGRVE